MSKKFLTTVDLRKNEIQQIVIHKLSNAPSEPAQYQIYSNTTNGRIYIYIGTSWKDITGRLDEIVAGDDCIILTDNLDGTYELDIALATQSNKGLLSSNDKLKLDSSTDSNIASTIVERDSLSNINVNAIIINEIQDGSTESSHAATIGYVNTVVSTGIKILGVIDCSSNPNYPAGKVGDSYKVSVAGKIGGTDGIVVEVGDLIVCRVDNIGGTEAEAGISWFIIQANIKAASETELGYIRIGTQVEVDGGIDDSVAVTPLKLASYVASKISSNAYAVTIGDGNVTSFIINHALNSTDVLIEIIDVSTGEVVEADKFATNNNNVTVTFTEVIGLNSYRVVIFAKV